MSASAAAQKPPSPSAHSSIIYLRAIFLYVLLMLIFEKHFVCSKQDIETHTNSSHKKWDYWSILVFSQLFCAWRCNLSIYLSIYLSVYDGGMQALSRIIWQCSNSWSTHHKARRASTNNNKHNTRKEQIYCPIHKHHPKRILDQNLHIPIYHWKHQSCGFQQSWKSQQHKQHHFKCIFKSADPSYIILHGYIILPCNHNSIPGGQH